ncbi:MAG: flagellar motor switch protein FliN [SAR324 cluster bacterium]|jgi:flagellar motor switch protein FliN/FliY|uniref:Flagellar motor switch protein FliN-like C-terminal domain-containing protein n=1 Tax=marine metagenome TaxID=408172 RepID=A0A382DX41_9ZZZZ|nr:flagellar motor switch protein FliN [Deltaproteobacteria bacterium]MAD99563.1 flagellar motor switch protein FliN [Pseudomonadota bacterium]MDP6091747.1 flagellar motor switch protein FliN [SAR324 cluster bacterium]MBP44715.1 flagellar motor switch protein FliN [Deltaproteobacteria bacterium]MDP6247638.1 flagellar motor switch protein FliN [SAR324 cluster bacterium]|tara:strand:+ start:884 stop:1339 length:456 start_codon:yes stop_codon:yes gene_type:complete
MAEEEESFENLDDLDWSDVEDELKANKDEILSQAAGEDGDEGGSSSGGADSSGAPSPTGGSSLKDGDLDINFLLDVNLSIMVEVGRTHMLIEDLLRLEESSIVELDSMVGQPLNIRANEKLVARGEIVVINEKFAVRITDIISPDDRFAAL